MALRNLARHISPFAASSSAWVRCASSSSAASAGAAPATSSSSASSSTPTVFDKMVQIFVIDKSGVRHTVRGLEGDTLATTLLNYGHFGQDAFMPHVYDPGHVDCHLYVQGDYLDKLGQLPAEQQDEHQKLIAQHVRGKARDNSRMGYYIKLSPQLNGMTVALGEVEPW